MPAFAGMTKDKKERRTMPASSVKWIAIVLAIVSGGAAAVHAQPRKPLEKLRLHVPARSLTFVPYYLGKSKGIFEKAGIDLEIIVMRPPIGVTALQAGEVEFSSSSGLSVRAAMKGLPLRTVFFSQTRLSFSLVGQPGMRPGKIKTVAVSGIGSLAHYAALTMMKRLDHEKVAYVTTNTTANSYASLTGKAVDAAVLSPPFTSIATLAGYVDLSNTFDLRDLQGGLVVRTAYIQSHREQLKAMIRGTLRSLEIIFKSEEEVVPYLQKDFGLEPKVAADSYRILKQVLSVDGDIEEPVLKSIVERIKQESGISAEVALDRLVDLSVLREVRGR
jgi:ABC-type nitrate/sulfonate/bicarbonate transport system substrate-binding protein